MNFRTEIQIKKSQEKISHKQKILLLGSCFAQNMQVKFAEGGFDAMHTFGAIYNPYSVANSFKLIAEKQIPSVESLFFQKDKWNSYAFHSSYSNADKNEAIRQMSEAITRANDILNSETNLDLAKQAFKLNSETYANHETGTFVQRIVTDPERLVNNLADIVDMVTEILSALVIV